ncbi:MAG: hypothetical protein ACXWQQ_16365 [Pseudobdellovibrio sp.]
MKKLILVLFSLALAAGCSKANDTTSSTATTASTHTYGVLGGSCYDYTSSTYVASTYCSTSTTNGYTLTNGICYSSGGVQVATGYCTSTTTGYYSSNGSCYSSSTNQMVSSVYCSSNTTTSGNGACYGNYIYNQNGYMQYGVCNGSNCSGYTLIQVSTGQTVYCQ